MTWDYWAIKRCLTFLIQQQVFQRRGKMWIKITHWAIFGDDEARPRSDNNWKNYYSGEKQTNSKPVFASRKTFFTTTKPENCLWAFMKQYFWEFINWWNVKIKSTRFFVYQLLSFQNNEIIYRRRLGWRWNLLPVHQLLVSKRKREDKLLPNELTHNCVSPQWWKLHFMS